MCGVGCRRKIISQPLDVVQTLTEILSNNYSFNDVQKADSRVLNFIMSVLTTTLSSVGSGIKARATKWSDEFTLCSRRRLLTYNTIGIN